MQLVIGHTTSEQQLLLLLLHVQCLIWKSGWAAYQMYASQKGGGGRFASSATLLFDLRPTPLPVRQIRVCPGKFVQTAVSMCRPLTLRQGCQNSVSRWFSSHSPTSSTDSTFRPDWSTATITQVLWQAISLQRHHRHQARVQAKTALRPQWPVTLQTLKTVPRL